MVRYLEMYQGPRGRCSECGKEYALRADGTMRLHRSMAADTWFCRGAGKPPAGQATKAGPS